jgi:hypothetical protein
MKLADIEMDDLLRALRTVRSEWISVAQNENRRPTEAESLMICVLAALEQVASALRRGGSR